MEKNRCIWVNLKSALYIKYHDEEWGRTEHDDRKLFELLILECFQAGLSWECVLNKRENFRRAFDGFDYDKIVKYDDAKIERLLSDTSIIRNKSKITAAISNARIFKAIQHEFGSFDSYLGNYCPDKPIHDHISTTSSLSDIISYDLKSRGMKYVGSTVIQAYLQAIGVIDAHEPSCYLNIKNKQ